jgi:electron transport complex protein RnfD
MANNIIVSGSPHIQTEQTVKSMMYHVVIALMPALLLSFYVFGIGALVVSLISIVCCIGFEFLIQKYILKVPTTISDGSALLTGILLALNLPAGFPIWMTVVGALVAIGIAKLSFGGLGNNIFNPALVARVFLLISFPVQMTKWPEAFADRMKLTDATTGATPLGFLKEALRGEGADVRELIKSLPDYNDMFIGFIGGSIGEISAVLLVLGGLYLLWKKVITWHIPFSILMSVFVFSGIMWLVDPSQYADPVFHLITGGLMLGTFYMATDLVTSPMSPKGQILFGVGIGLLTMLIRYFGAYPEGVSFAILIMNAFVPLIDRFLKVKKFGI